MYEIRGLTHLSDLTSLFSLSPTTHRYGKWAGVTPAATPHRVEEQWPASAGPHGATHKIPHQGVTHTRTHARTHARGQARGQAHVRVHPRARTHAHTHTHAHARTRTRCPRDGLLAEGMKVEARYRGKARYYPGRIKRDNRDGTFDVDYDDGEKEARVLSTFVRPEDGAGAIGGGCGGVGAGAGVGGGAAAVVVDVVSPEPIQAIQPSHHIHNESISKPMSLLNMSCWHNRLHFEAFQQHRQPRHPTPGFFCGSCLSIPWCVCLCVCVCVFACALSCFSKTHLVVQIPS